MRLLKFYATWCEPCKQLSKVIDRNKENISSQLTIQEIDIDNDRNSAIAMRVRSVPTLIIVDDEGVELARHVGAMTDQVFKEFCIVREDKTQTGE